MNGGIKALENIPVPQPTIGCQDLLTLRETNKHGTLRKRSGLTGFLTKKFEALGKVVKWGHRMVVVSGGCIYVYKSELEKRPVLAFSLYGYNKLESEKDKKQAGGNSWVFKLIPVQLKQEVFYFACTSEFEMKEWMHAVREEMKIAHSIAVDDAFSVCSDTSLSGLEEPIYDSTAELGNPPPSPHTAEHEDSDSSDSSQEYNEINPQHMNPLQRHHDNPGTISAKNMPLPTLPGKGMPESRIPCRPAPEPPTSDLNRRKPPPVPTEDEVPPEEPAASRVSRPAVGMVQATKEKLVKPAVPKKPPGGISIMPGGIAMTQEMLKSPTSKSPVRPNGVLDPPPRPGRPNDSPQMPKDRAPNPAKKQVPPIPKGRPGSNHSGASATNRAYTATSDPSEGLYEVAISDQKVLEPEDYYRRALFDDPDKDKSSKTIKELGVEGAFLIRPGNAGSEQVLVVYAENDTRKYKLNNEGGKYYINSDLRFDDLNELIVYYMQNNLPKRTTKLKKPYKDIK